MNLLVVQDKRININTSLNWIHQKTDNAPVVGKALSALYACTVLRPISICVISSITINTSVRWPTIS